MPRSKMLLMAGLFATVLTFIVGVDFAFADEAADALAKCDALASHPQDPKRYAAPVPDDRFAPGAAIDACELANKLNPDSGRVWFELGRAYWIGERDKDAFRAFVEAKKREYPIAYKFIGDAYLEGRGLPSGESQSPQIAMQWYQKAVDAGYRDGQIAIDEVQTAIQKQQETDKHDALVKQQEENARQIDQEKDNEKKRAAQFDLTIFQNKKFISNIYYGYKLSTKNIMFLYYLQGFVDKFGGVEPFFSKDGQACLPRVAGTTTGGISGALMNLFPEITGLALNAVNNMPLNFLTDGVYIPDSIKNFSVQQSTVIDQGDRDGIALFNRYGCNGEVTKIIINNINALFSNSYRIINPSGFESASVETELPVVTPKASAAGIETLGPSSPSRHLDGGQTNSNNRDWGISRNCEPALDYLKAAKIRGVHGAFAVSRNIDGGCGHSWSPTRSMTQMRNQALAYCRQYGNDCKIIYEQ